MTADGKVFVILFAHDTEMSTIRSTFDAYYTVAVTIWHYVLLNQGALISLIFDEV